MISYDKNDPETIKLMFGDIAQHYDRLNAILSFKLHRFWNASFVRKTIIPAQPTSLLDLCCGTGDIAYGYLSKTSSKTTVYMLDFCEEMLAHAKTKAEQMHLNEKHDLIFLQADAQHIPLPSSSIDCVTISYGIRNIKSPLKCLSEVFRVLKPGGVLGILELTRPANPVLRLLHQIYLRTVFPLVGKLVASNQAAYQYLCNSIHSFMLPKDLIEIIIEAGFTDVQSKTHLGGIATIFLGKRK
jgi:demethylmenaquinone methyltransferase/2-methoxy-6-polyprenyl-1,4-benzoquinol methylase